MLRLHRADGPTGGPIAAPPFRVEAKAGTSKHPAHGTPGQSQDACQVAPGASMVGHRAERRAPTAPTTQRQGGGRTRQA